MLSQFFNLLIISGTLVYAQQTQLLLNAKELAHGLVAITDCVSDATKLATQISHSPPIDSADANVLYSTYWFLYSPSSTSEITRGRR